MSASTTTSDDPLPTPDDVNDQTLMARIATDEQEAFEELYERHGRAVYLYASSILNRGDRAKDAAQETWIAFWNARRRITLSTDSALPWLLVTARYRALHLLQDRHERNLSLDSTGVPIAGHHSDPILDAEHNDLVQFVTGLVDGMSAVDRELFTRCIRDGHSYESVSRDLGIGVDAVKHRIFRIRRRMRVAITAREES